MSKQKKSRQSVTVRGTSRRSYVADRATITVRYMSHRDSAEDRLGDLVDARRHIGEITRTVDKSFTSVCLVEPVGESSDYRGFLIYTFGVRDVSSVRDTIASLKSGGFEGLPYEGTGITLSWNLSETARAEYERYALRRASEKTAEIAEVITGATLSPSDAASLTLVSGEHVAVGSKGEDVETGTDFIDIPEIDVRVTIEGVYLVKR